MKVSFVLVRKRRVEHLRIDYLASTFIETVAVGDGTGSFPPSGSARPPLILMEVNFDSNRRFSAGIFFPGTTPPTGRVFAAAKQEITSEIKTRSGDGLYLGTERVSRQ